MATPAQIAANRRNAQRSTGPRTAAGRARAAHNARTHGLTGVLERAQVLDWFRCIVDDPTAEPHSPDAATRAALALALAEAQLARVKETEVAFLAEQQADAHAVAASGPPVTETAQDPMERFLAGKGLNFISQASEPPNFEEDEEERPLTWTTMARYRREAEAQRHTALRHWLRYASDCGRTKPEKP